MSELSKSFPESEVSETGRYAARDAQDRTRLKAASEPELDLLISFPGEVTMDPILPSAPRTPVPSAGTEGLGLTLHELRTVGARLVRAYGRLEEQYQELDGRSSHALDILAAIEGRVGSLQTHRDLATVTGERFAALAGLGDEIARRTTALEAQGVTIDAGLATARHVTDAFAAFEARLQRVATSAAHLEGRAVTFDAQAAAIQHALSNANRAAATVDDVSARVDALAASGASLDRAADVVAAVEAAAHRCERIDADLAQHVGHIEAHEHRLAEATSRASALQAAVDSLDARVAALSQAQPVLLGAQATVERLERVAAEATAQLQTVATATADLERVLALAKTRTQGVAEYAERQTFEAELRRIGAGSLGQVVARAARRLGVAKRPVNWGSASSGAWTIDWAMGAGALALVVSLGVLLAGSRGQDGVVETTRRARLETVTPSAVTPSAAALAAVDAAVRDVAPRTVDIVLPPARARATASRAGAPKPKRIVPSGR